MKASRRLIAVLLIVLFALAVGCASSTPKTFQAGTRTTSQPSTPKETSGGGRYYDFPDIQVPAGMDLEKDRSIIFTVGSIKAGMLVFRDYVDADSLFNFYLEAMAKDAWALKSSNKYPTSALFYAKQGRTCVIHIVETTFYTELAIWVAPTN